MPISLLLQLTQHFKQKKIIFNNIRTIFGRVWSKIALKTILFNY